MQIARDMDDFDGRPRRVAMDTYERPRQIVVSGLGNAVTLFCRIEMLSDVPHSGRHVWHLAKPDVNGASIWTYSSSYTGPGIYNLNSSTTYKLGPWPF